MKYDMVTGIDRNELVQQLRFKLQGGWEPHGTPLYVGGEWVQAIVKDYELKTSTKTYWPAGGGPR